MNIFKAKANVLFIFLILFIGTTATVFSAPKKEISSTINSGSVTKKLGVPGTKGKPAAAEKRLHFDLSIEHIGLDQRCRVIVELKNKGRDTIPESIFKRVKVNAVFGKLKVNKELNLYDRKMNLRYPGKKLTWKTGIIAEETGIFSTMIDMYNVLKEANEANNRKNINLIPRCKSKTKKIGKRTLKDQRIRAENSAIPPLPRGPGDLRPRSLERGIRIVSPTEGQRYFSGSTINIRFRLQNQSDASGIVPVRVTSVFLYLDGTEVAALGSSSRLPAIRAGTNSIGIGIPRTATAADGYTVTVTAQRPSGERIFGISDRFSVEHRTVSASATDRLRSRTRDEGISITSPRSGQRYMPGGTIPVRYSISTTFDHPSPDTRPTAFRVLLYRSSGTPINLYEGSETDLDLPIPESAASGEDYRILIQGMEDPSWYGVAGLFSIGLSRPGMDIEERPPMEVAPFIRIAEPTGVIAWKAGCTQRITLMTNVALTRVNLKLLTGPSGRMSVIQSNTYRAGLAKVVDGKNQYSIFYQIPPDAGDNGRLGHYGLGVEQIGGEALEVISDNIWLHQAEYQLVQPVGGMYYRRGGNLTITWKIIGCAAESYDIQLIQQPPGDLVVTNLRTGLDASYTSESERVSEIYTQTFRWSIPEDIVLGLYKVRLVVHESGDPAGPVERSNVYESGAFFIER